MSRCSHLQASRVAGPEVVPARRQGDRLVAGGVLMLVLFLTFPDKTVVSVALGSVQSDLNAAQAAVGGLQVPRDEGLDRRPGSSPCW